MTYKGGKTIKTKGVTLKITSPSVHIPLCTPLHQSAQASTHGFNPHRVYLQDNLVCQNIAAIQQAYTCHLLGNYFQQNLN